MYEMVKNVVSFIHLFMILMETWIFEFPSWVCSTDYRVCLVSCVLSVKWLISTLGIRLNWVVLPHVRHCRLRWVSHLIDAQSGSWDETLVRRYLYACDVEEIPCNACSDQVAWNFEKTGIFSVRSAYRLAMRREHGEGEIGSSSTLADGRKVWKTLWSPIVPEKVKVFA